MTTNPMAGKLTSEKVQKTIARIIDDKKEACDTDEKVRATLKLLPNVIGVAASKTKNEIISAVKSWLSYVMLKQFLKFKDSTEVDTIHLSDTKPAAYNKWVAAIKAKFGTVSLEDEGWNDAVAGLGLIDLKKEAGPASEDDSDGEDSDGGDDSGGPANSAKKRSREVQLAAAVSAAFAAVALPKADYDLLQSYHESLDLLAVARNNLKLTDGDLDTAEPAPATSARALYEAMAHVHKLQWPGIAAYVDALEAQYLGSAAVKKKKKLDTGRATAAALAIDDAALEIVAMQKVDTDGDYEEGVFGSYEGARGPFVVQDEDGGLAPIKEAGGSSTIKPAVLYEFEDAEMFDGEPIGAGDRVWLA